MHHTFNLSRAKLSLRARISVHAIRKCSIYVDLFRFQYNSTIEGTVEGLAWEGPSNDLFSYLNIEC